MSISRELLIIEKAIDLFARNGIEATSVQDITNACGISKGAFYLSFKSKEELLVAIIDRFMKKIIAKNASVIRQELPVRDRLFQYYLLNFKIFYEYSSFITIYMREHIRTVNEEIVEKMNEFDKRNDETVLLLVDEILGEDRHTYRYDLMTMMKGFVFSYANYIFHHPQKYDLEHLAHVLVQRTFILAEHQTDRFITQQSWEQTMMPTHHPTIETVMQLAEELTSRYLDDTIVTQSLQLLIDEIKSPNPRQAIVKGLIANLIPYEEMSWFIYSVEIVLRTSKRS